MSLAGTGVLHEVRREIRRRICSGMWPPGARLPTREALAKFFAASPSTIQLVIRSLVQEGSVVTRKRGGSYVAASPPECSHFALVLSNHVVHLDQRPTYLLDCMAHSTARIAELRPGWRMTYEQAGDPRLAEAVRQGALAGILYFGSPLLAPAVTGSRIPLAAFIVPDQPPWAAVNIMIDNRVLLERSLRCHLERGRKRIAVLDNSGLITHNTASRPLPDQFRHIAEAVRAAGGACEPSWIHCVDPRNPITAYQTSLLLLDRAAEHRPEALVLLDDYLLSPVLAAIRHLGLRIPADLSLSVQAHNLPEGAPDGCIRVGFEVAPVMAEIVDLLAQDRRGAVVPQLYHLRFDELGGPAGPAISPPRRRVRPGAG